MGLRFQTRLLLTVSALILLTVAVMILLNIWTVTATEIQNYRTMGETSTGLAQANIDYSVLSQEITITSIRDQLIVSALLAARLVDLAENDAGMSSEQISDMFREIVEHSEELAGEPVIDEVLVTDETGAIYIGTEDYDFTFRDDPESRPQSSEFYKLLEGEEVVSQYFQPRDYDDKIFAYVGVTGSDKPRVVQIGLSEEVLGGFSPYFNVQNVVDGFFRELDVSRIAVINYEGAVLASAYAPDEAGGIDSTVIALARRHLESGTPVEVTPFEDDIAVVTRLDPSAPNVTGSVLTDSPLALFIQYRTKDFAQSIQNNITFISLFGVVTLAITLLVCMFLARSFSRPLSELAEGVRAFGRGHLDQRVHLRSHDEIQDLAQTFNAMAGSIQDYMQELEIETQRRERLESELRIAAEMQASLLPETPPDLHGVTIVGWSQPAREVGGDFYDFIEYDDGRLGVVIADATGKGLSAAMLTTECWSVLKALAGDITSPADLLTRTNNALCRRLNHSGKFITLFFMILDPRTSRITYALAGHNPPVLTNGEGTKIVALRSDQGFPLGLFPDAKFADHTLELDRSDTVLLYSDGLTEAHDPEDRMYGEERLRKVLKEHSSSDLDTIVSALRDDVTRHMRGREIFDDMTMVAVRYMAKAESAVAG